MKVWLSVLLFAVTANAASSVFSSDIAATEAKARAEGKPILWDFGAIWCPPCNELKETVFGMPAFLDKAKRFELVEVDVDSPKSWPAKDRFRVGGYPTIVFTDSRGKEIFRIVGYRSLKEFLRIMDLVLASKDSDFKKACRSRDANELWRCATVCAERKDASCAETAYHKLENQLAPSSPQYQDARTYFVENAPNEDLKRDGYERLLAELPQSPRAVLWAADYLALFNAEKKPAPKRDLVEKVLADYTKSTEDPAREAMGISVTDMAEARADVLEKLGESEKAKVAWQEAAKLLQLEAEALPAGVSSRGFNLERIECLESAGDLDAAIRLAEEYRAKYPQEFTFHYFVASLYYRAKRYGDAIPVAKKAYEVSYGDNRIRSATLLVNLYATVPDRASAQKIFDEVNKEIQPGDKLEVRTPRYLKNLREAMGKFPASNRS
jgi:thioredoxin-related protein